MGKTKKAAEPAAESEELANLKREKKSWENFLTGNGITPETEKHIYSDIIQSLDAKIAELEG